MQWINIQCQLTDNILAAFDAHQSLTQVPLSSLIEYLNQ